MTSSPDLDREEEHVDDQIPSRGYQLTPIVGIGASAGGIAPLLEFFRAIPADSGVVFVVVVHLAPTHSSALSSLIARTTTMQVHEALDGETVEPNHVYVIPPGHYLTSVDDKLSLSPMTSPPGRRNTVDVFFRTLADTHGPHAIAIVMSGADSDGAVGIKRIKERGGLTIVQDPNEAEHSSMPRATIGTGMADWVLKTAEMPQRILDYLASERRLKLPPEQGPRVALAPRTKEDHEAALRDVLVFLRTRTGRDFTSYKRATILRRIARRMQVNGVEGLHDYQSFLRTHPGEAGALLQDLLISVTNFFRDREAFDALEHDVIPSLFANKETNEHVRVWIPACATGEEAYSIAMLLFEHAQTLDSPPAIQVFGSDLNEDAIQSARVGVYPDSIATDVTEERLKRFFTRESGGYRVRREVREVILFATHDLLKDPPFSRMDLISCRNLLIYLGRDAQERVQELFHFAVQPGGKLFLGTSEAIDETSHLFRPLDKKHRIYVQQPVARSFLPVPLGPSTLLRAVQSQPLPAHAKAAAAISNLANALLEREPDPHRLAELHFKLIDRYSSPSVLVNAQHELVHISERAGRILRFGGGEPTLDLLKTVDPAIRATLRAALFRASETGAPVDAAQVSMELDGRTQSVTIHVTPTPEIGPGYMLVVFATLDVTRSETAPVLPDALVRSLEREVEHAKLQLRATVEQSEASGEELKASNEELQAMNEELRSASEELETSREELQSINEELTTVNQEMKVRMDALGTANADLQNLLSATSIATVFLDTELAIMRYTPLAADIFHLIPSDVGRPLAHLKPTLDYPQLIADAEKVHETLVPIEREVQSGARWFLARLQPYRAIDDRIGGVVITLIDVTERNHAMAAQRLSEERLKLIIASATDYAIFTVDPERHIETWSAGAEALFGFTSGDVIGKLVDDLFTSEERGAAVPRQEMDEAREAGRSGGERWYFHKNGSKFFGSGSMVPLRERGAVKGYVTIIRDLTATKRAQDELRDHVDELTRFNAAAVGREERMIALKKEINALAARLGEAARYKVEE